MRVLTDMLCESHYVSEAPVVARGCHCTICFAHVTLVAAPMQASCGEPGLIYNLKFKFMSSLVTGSCDVRTTIRARDGCSAIYIGSEI